MVLVLLLFISSKTFSQSEVLSDGEELIYEVYYSFINIGWTKLTTNRVIGTKNRYICEAVLKSNDALPFVTVDYNFISEIEIDGSVLKPLKFTGKEFKDGRVSTITYAYNYDSFFVDIKKIGFNNEVEYRKRMHIYSIYYDGLSIFYYARFNYFADKSEYVPVLMNQDSISVKLDFNTGKTEAEISEVNYDISSLHLEGRTDYEMVFGLTGDFSGWFSNDNTRIPVKAKFKVKIGSVTLELKAWKRKNWSPPKY
jgi:hypothetical protein